MKRITIFLFIAVLLVGSIYAQDRETRQRENNPVTVEGTLKLERGFAALESGDTVYYVPMLTRFMGFISELREGAAVSVEGNAFRNFIQPEKVTVDGKSYDFTELRVPAFGQSVNPGNTRQARETPAPRRGENLRQTTPRMQNAPRFNQQNRNNRPGNTCSCNCRSGSPQRRF